MKIDERSRQESMRCLNQRAMGRDVDHRRGVSRSHPGENHSVFGRSSRTLRTTAVD
jgi:hypothetical protein